MDPPRPDPLRTVPPILLCWIVLGGVWAEGAESRGDSPFAQAGNVPNVAPANPGDADDSGAEDQFAQVRGIFATPDRTLLRLLSKAEQLADQDRCAEAVRCLGAILDTAEDYFFQPDRTGPVHRSLKSEAQRLLGEMPRRGRELYELQYGARARRLLNDAAVAGDAYELAEVSRRFFHTQAGYEATLLLGLHHLTEGRPLGAALTLKRLTDACPEADRFEPMLSTALAACWIHCGMPEKAWQTLAEFNDRNAEGRVTIAGQEVPLFVEEVGALEWPITEDQAFDLLASEDNPLGRLAKLVGSRSDFGPCEDRQWAMLRGNAARNASVSGSAPLLSVRWRVPTTDHPYVEAMIDGLRQDDENHGRDVLPGLHALSVGDKVLMRTARTLLAVDFATGKRVWEVPVDDPYEPLLNAASNPGFRPAVQLGQALRVRMWGDATYGTMSSDGRFVFMIEDLGLQGSPANVRGMFFNAAGRTRAVREPVNRLAAYDIETGKLKWHLGGSAQQYGLAEAGAFFLGPPLPLMKQLFALVEVKGEIRLLVLDARTGDLLWSQQLADAERGILVDPLRRFAGVSPSYADGILVCPTCNRSIVAVELATRSLLWGYTYSSSGNQSQQQRMFMGVRTMAAFDPDRRWTDSSLTLAGGRVLATPVDSTDVQCLNLIDGQPLWQRPREDDLYLACVYGQAVVMVGRDKVRALRLDDGQPAWDERTVAFPEGSVPSGTGFLSGNLYFVPLSSAEVMAVDVETGRVAYVSKSRRGSVPGNLICHRDKIISQRPGAVEVFHQLGALKEQVDRRLAAKPDDGKAMALRGEILWHEGKLADAIEVSRRALELGPDPRTRELLREAFFEGLRLDFAAYRKDVDEVERLIDTPRQRATFLRLMAVGHEDVGEYRAALERYQDLIEVDREHRRMEPLGHQLAVRRDRWIQVRLAKLREAAPADDRNALDTAAEARLESAIADSTPEALEEFLDYFGGLPAAERARRELVERLRQSGQFLAAELLLRGQERLGDVPLAAAAVAELAEVLCESRRWEDAATCYERLRDEFADVPCRDGKTGREIVKELPADGPVRSALEKTPPWPEGKVEIQIGAVPKKTRVAPLTSTIECRGSSPRFPADYRIELRPNPPMLLSSDAWGKPRWQLSLSSLPRRQGTFMNRNLIRAAAEGHLMLLRTGDTLTAVDTLGETDQHGPRILWSKDLEASGREAEPSDDVARLVAARFPGGGQAMYFARGHNAALEYPVIASEQLLCVMRLRTCIAMDPATGETLWVHDDLPPQSAVFGDHEYLFVVPPDESEARVLRTVDGQLVGTRPIPPKAERLATFGRRILVWSGAENHRVLEMIDPWDHGKAWPSRKFASDALLDLVEEEHAAAVLEPDGRFVLVDLSDGRALIDVRLEPEPSLSGILVLPSQEHYMLVTQTAESPTARDPNRQVRPVPSTQSVRIGRGRVYAFDREGSPLWASPQTVRDQYLPLDQPSRLPILTFATVVRERKGRGKYKTGVSVLAIDKRNGRKVLDTTFDSPTNRFRMVGDPRKRTVQLEFQSSTVTLTFTDAPLPPEPKGDADTPPPDDGGLSTALQAIWNAVRRAAVGPPLVPVKQDPSEPE